MSNLKKLANRESIVLSEAIRRFHHNEESEKQSTLSDCQAKALDQLVEGFMKEAVAAPSAAPGIGPGVGSGVDLPSVPETGGIRSRRF